MTPQTPQKLSIGPLVGPNFSYQKYRSVVKPLAEQLLSEVEGIANVRLWYNRREDFIYIGFDLDGNHYQIRYYKTYTLYKNYYQRTSFGSDSHQVLDFLKAGEHTKMVCVPQVYYEPCDRFAKQVRSYAHTEWPSENNIPDVWERASSPTQRTYYLGVEDDDGMYWLIGVRQEIGAKDAPQNEQFHIVKHDGTHVSYTTTFQTAMQYALQSWPWNQPKFSVKALSGRCHRAGNA